jgi:uncharacterized membrane protein (DUF4010 family)
MIIEQKILFQIFLSLLLGALIGSQREIWQKKEKVPDFAGFRTFTLISLFGFLSAYFSELNKSNLILIISFISIILFDLISYFELNKKNNKKISIITQICSILTFLIGVFIYFNLIYISITIAILISSILFLGDKFHQFTYKLSETEIFATIKFGIISLIILPLLPNKNYSLLDIPIFYEIIKNQNLISLDIIKQIDVFNPFYIWLLVVFISGISYIGYILMKLIGSKKGILLTGFLGGLVSSTAVTTAFSIESKKLKYLYLPLALGVIIACSTMFFRILIEVIVINSELFLYILIPMIIMGSIGFLGSYIILKRTKLDHIKELSFKSPFTIIPSIKFAIFFIIIIFFSKLFSIILGEKGIYLISFISGITDVDAITLSLANLAKNSTISNQTASLGIIIATFSNTLMKGFFAYYLGTRKFAKVIFIMFGIIMTIGFITLLII